MAIGKELRCAVGIVTMLQDISSFTALSVAKRTALQMSAKVAAFRA
jgi:hypothetical protein